MVKQLLDAKLYCKSEPLAVIVEVLKEFVGNLVLVNTFINDFNIRIEILFTESSD